MVGSLCDMSLQYPDLVSRYYGKVADMKRDGTVALNTAFAQDGFFLYIPDGVIVEKPIQLVNILRGNVDFMVNRRLLIVVGKRAQAKLLVCDHSDEATVKFLSSQVCEIFVDDDAVFDYYDIEESSENTSKVSSVFVRQGERSNVLVNGIVLHNGVTRNNYYSAFEGEHAELSLCGMAIADKGQVVDTYTHIDHAVPHCHSNELFKYVLNDSARGSFSGRILVRHGAQKTEAYQSNKNLCASPLAKMYTKPQLEIYADDVKCSHGATVGQLDQNALFYMRSRGIPESEARMLLMFAFTGIMEERPRKFFLWTVLAGCIHTPAFVFLPAYWFAKSKLSMHKLLIYIASAGLIFLFRTQIVTFVSEFYYEEASYMVNDRLGGRFIMIVALLIAGVALRGFSGKNFSKLFNLIVIAAILQMFSGFDNVFTRLTDYYFQFLVLYLPMMFYPERDERLNNGYQIRHLALTHQQRSAAILCVVLLAGVYYYTTNLNITITNAIDDYLNYRFSWEVPVK